MEFEIKIDANLKLKVLDYSMRCTRSDSITIYPLERQKNGEWMQVGDSAIYVWSREHAEWVDIKINDRSRGRGIGKKIVKFAVGYLKENGVKAICGEISSVDEIDKVIKFWKENGFSVNVYPQPKGNFVAAINLTL